MTLKNLRLNPKRRIRASYPLKSWMIVKELTSPAGKSVCLGAYKTREQAARALDVGKFFFSEFVGSNYNFPETPWIFLPCMNLMDQFPASKRILALKLLAKYYADMGESLSEIIKFIPQILRWGMK